MEEQRQDAWVRIQGQEGQRLGGRIDKGEGEPQAHPICPTHLFHNPETPSPLTLAEKSRGHIAGQLQEAGRAGPAVLSYLAG